MTRHSTDDKLYGTQSLLQEGHRILKGRETRGLSVGTHEIDGDNLWVNIVETDLRPASVARLEAHDKYIDLQVPLSGDEYFGVKPRKECGEAKDINAGNDIMFFDDPVTETVHVKAGDSITFAPDTAHAPLIGTGRIKKAIFKIKVV